MSSGTNQERITQNNTKLAELKTKADNLPEYQDIEPIYGLYNYTSFNRQSYNSSDKINSYGNSIGNICKYNNYVVIFYLSSTYYPCIDLYKITDSGVENLIVRKQISSSAVNLSYPYYTATILGFKDNKLYIMFTNNISGGAYNSDLEGVWTINVNTLEYELYDADTVWRNTWAGKFLSNTDDYTLWLPYNDSYNTKIIIYDIENKTLSVKSNGITFMTNKYTVIHKDYFLTFTSGNQLNQFKKVNWNSSTSRYDIIEKTYAKSSYSYIKGVNYTGTKVFTTNGIYSLSSDLVIGSKIANYNITVDANSTPYIYCISDEYYFYNSNLYKFNEETNEFTLISNIPNSTTDFNGNGIIVQDAKVQTIWLGITSKMLIGYKVNGNSLYITDVYAGTTSDVLISKQVYNEKHQIIVGTMPNNGALSYTPTTSQQTIPAGYTSGGTIAAVTSDVDSNLIPENIKEGVTIFGVTGTYTGSDVSL